MNYETEKPSLFNLAVDEEMKFNLRETAKWARFLSVIGFVLVGIIILIGAFSAMSTLQDNEVIPNAIGVIIGIFIIGLLYLYPIITLFQFGRKMKLALLHNDQIQMNAALKCLKNCFLYLGVMAIIVIVIYGTIAMVFLFYAASSL